MSQNKQAATTSAPKREIYYKSIRFAPDFVMAMGQSFSSSTGNLLCSTTKQPSQFSARWVPGSAVLCVRWKTSNGDIIEYDIPWARVMGATRIPDGDEPADLR